jgi:hypothetical protein
MHLERAEKRQFDGARRSRRPVRGWIQLRAHN